MSVQLSLVTGFRNREIQRVTRFLDSLQTQTYQDFELIFVDYGSDPHVSAEAVTLCNKYRFCRYLFTDTGGHLWNRAHALNIGIQAALGKYFLSADIDLIYSHEVLRHLMSAIDDSQQIFCHAYLLPGDFSEYSTLNRLRADFPTTKSGTLGLFHGVLMKHVRAIGGYDEYYRIWGFEDNDFAKHLDQAGLSRTWLDVRKAPIYHQWHRAGSIHPMMEWWWEDMSTYHALKDRRTTAVTNWGTTMTSTSRPLNLAQETLEYTCPKAMNPFRRRESITHILDLLSKNPDTRIIVELHKEAERTSVQSDFKLRMIAKVVNVINRVSRNTKSMIQISASDAEVHRSENKMLYFIYNLILKSDLILDYRFDEFPDRYRVTLLSKLK